MNQFLSSAIVVAAFLAMPPAAVAMQATDQSNVAIVMPNSAVCTPPIDGEGLSPDEPLELSPGELYDLIADHLAHDEANPYECRWVRMVGHFRATNYWHYEGRIFPSLGTFYFDSPMNGPASFIIEDFADHETQKFDIHGSEIEITGLLYDLCAAADAEARQLEEAEGISVINLGGPCHYGNLNGLMLSDVRIVEILSDSEMRMRGEANRTTLGTLANVPDDHPVRPNVREAFEAWIEAAQTSEEALLANFLNEEDLAEALADENDWSSLLTGANSPLRSIDLSSSNRATAYFVEREAFSDFMAGDYEYAGVTACICRMDDCQGAWPLFEADTVFFHRDYICERIGWDDDTGWSAWN